ncbi:MAG TPA: hypothetical protein DHW02_02750 [Ktedonobacter sp.]|nr:hypothetical protein [Ktedonobacter sp.]
MTKRLEAAASYKDTSLFMALFKEYEIPLRLLENHPSVFYAEHSTGAAFNLLLWSHRGTHPDYTHQWYALAMRLLTLQLYRETYGSLPINIQWIIDTRHRYPDSSITSPLHIMEHNHLFLQVDGCICDLANPSSFPALALGTKGLLRVSLEPDLKQANAPAIYGSVLPDAAWRLAWCLNSLKDAREELLIDGFYDTLTPPEDDEIALLADAPLVEQAFQQDGHIPLLGLQGLQARYAAQFLPTCTITSLSTGIQKSVLATLDKEHQAQEPHTIPTKAQASLDFYLVPDQQPEDIFLKVRQHVSTHGFQDIQVQLLASTPSVHTSLRHAFIQMIHAAATVVRDDKHFSTKALTLIPFATEHIFPNPLSNIPVMAIIFNQFGTIGRNDASDLRTQAIQLAHIAHFSVLLEELQHATGTTR